MFREIFNSFSQSDRERFCSQAEITPATLRAKYLSPNPRLRMKPAQDRFDAMLAAANDIRPGCITREQLAAYFYAASGRTGTGKPKAA